MVSRKMLWVYELLIDVRIQIAVVLGNAEFRVLGGLDYGFFEDALCSLWR